MPKIISLSHDYIPGMHLYPGEKHAFKFDGWFAVVVPAVIGAGGVERIIEIDLTDAERQALQKSIDAVKILVGDMAKLVAWYPLRWFITIAPWSVTYALGRLVGL